MKNKLKSRSLKTKERVVPRKLSQVPGIAVWRYRQVINKGLLFSDTVLDFGCGAGYGSYLMSLHCKNVIGIDNSQETIDFASKYWKRDNVHFKVKALEEIKQKFDVVVCLETLEHVKEDKELFNKLLDLTDRLLVISVPHVSEKKIPKFHWKHYTEEMVKEFVKSKNNARITHFEVKYYRPFKDKDGATILMFVKKYD